MKPEISESGLRGRNPFSFVTPSQNEVHPAEREISLGPIQKIPI